MRSKLGQDFWAGLLFAAFGVTAIVIARGYKLGTTAHMGPGYMPVAVGVLLVLFGVALALRSSLRGSLRVEHLAWFATGIVLISILAFAYLVRSIGLAVTTIVLVILCRIAGRYWNWSESALLAIGVAIMVVAIFLKGLGMSLPLWPGQD
jgi:Tripartite tricarboxylate transporter TctB family